DYVLVITLCIRRTSSKRGTPEKRLRIEWGHRRRCCYDGIDQRSSRCSIAVTDQRLCSCKNRIRWPGWNLGGNGRRSRAEQRAEQDFPSRHLTTLLFTHAAALASPTHRLSTSEASNCSSDETLLSLRATSASSRE